MDPAAGEIIAALGLQPHPEGGWYRETWRGEAGAHGFARGAGSSILFLLKPGERSHWRRIDAAELWLFQAGGGLRLRTESAASIVELLKQANFDDPSAIPGGGQSLPTQGFELPNFQQAMQDAQVSSIDLLRDVELDVKIELGRSRMLVEDVLKLAEGSVVELDKLAGDPVDVFVNERLVARGEVLVLNDNFCVRVNEIVAGVKEEG